MAAEKGHANMRLVCSAYKPQTVNRETETVNRDGEGIISAGMNTRSTCKDSDHVDIHMSTSHNTGI